MKIPVSQSLFLKKETLAQVFSCEFNEICQNKNKFLRTKITIKSSQRTQN